MFGLALLGILLRVDCYAFLHGERADVLESGLLFLPEEEMGVCPCLEENNQSCFKSCNVDGVDVSGPGQFVFLIMPSYINL